MIAMYLESDFFQSYRALDQSHVCWVLSSLPTAEVIIRACRSSSFAVHIISTAWISVVVSRRRLSSMHATLTLILLTGISVAGFSTVNTV